MSESDLNQRLRNAVKNAPVPADLEVRVRSRLREEPAARGRNLWLIPAGAAALTCTAVLAFYHLGYLRYTRAARESYIASVSASIGTLMRVGLGDHVHCAVFARPHPPVPPGQELGPQYEALAPITRRYVPSDYKMLVAHRCSYHGRRFVHLIFSNDAHLLSLVIARKSEGESFAAQGFLPALVESGIPMYQAGVQRFAISAFETRDDLVYVISDLSPADNTQIMTAMAPAIKNLLEKL